VTFRNILGKFAVDDNSWESRVRQGDFAGRNTDAVRAASGYFTRNNGARFRHTAAAEFRGTKIVETFKIPVNGNPGGDAGIDQNLDLRRGFDRQSFDRMVCKPRTC
jgi:hypothetical protein